MTTENTSQDDDDAADDRGEPSPALPPKQSRGRSSSVSSHGSSLLSPTSPMFSFTNRPLPEPPATKPPQRTMTIHGTPEAYKVPATRPKDLPAPHSKPVLSPPALSPDSAVSTPPTPAQRAIPPPLPARQSTIFAAGTPPPLPAKPSSAQKPPALPRKSVRIKSTSTYEPDPP